MTYENMYHNYLTAYVASADAWELASAVGFDEDKIETKAHRNTCKLVRSLEVGLINHPETEVYTVAISGYCNGATSHYDIDKKMEATFADYVGDSESGSFFGFCKSSNVEAISEYLNIKFAGISFEVTDAKDVVAEEGFNADDDFVSFFIPGAGNWSAARETLKYLEA